MSCLPAFDPKLLCCLVRQVLLFSMSEVLVGVCHVFERDGSRDGMGYNL